MDLVHLRNLLFSSVFIKSKLRCSFTLISSLIAFVQVQNAANRDEVEFHEYSDLQLQMWSRFYACLVQYHEVRIFFHEDFKSVFFKHIKICFTVVSGFKQTVGFIFGWRFKRSDGHTKGWMFVYIWS